MSVFLEGILREFMKRRHALHVTNLKVPFEFGIDAMRVVIANRHRTHRRRSQKFLEDSDPLEGDECDLLR